MTKALASMLTALADDELILGHRHSEWTGHAPHLEEDVAFSSIAQDEIGHAAAYYSLLAEITDDDADHLALGRGRDEYRNAVVCERPNKEWGYTLARHWLYDHADAIRLENLAGSSNERVAALVNKIRREERYHLIHADMWVKRVARGPVEGRMKLAQGVAAAYDDVLGLFEPFQNEEAAVYEGLMPDPSSDMQRLFEKEMSAAIDDLGLPTATPKREGAEFVASSSGDLIAGDESREAPRPGLEDSIGGRHGFHSADFNDLWDVMTKTYRENPGASW